MTFKLLFIFGDSVISPPPPVAVASAVVTTALDEDALDTL